MWLCREVGEMERSEVDIDEERAWSSRSVIKRESKGGLLDLDDEIIFE